MVLFELPLSAFTMRMPQRQMIAIGFLLVGIGFGLTGLAHSFPALALTVAVWTFGEMVAAPVGYAYVADIAPTHMRGRYQGLFGLCFGSGAIFGPAIGTFLYSRWETQFWAICAGLGLLAAVLTLGGRSSRTVVQTVDGMPKRTAEVAELAPRPGPFPVDDGHHLVEPRVPVGNLQDLLIGLLLIEHLEDADRPDSDEHSWIAGFIDQREYVQRVSVAA